MVFARFVALFFQHLFDHHCKVVQQSDSHFRRALLGALGICAHQYLADFVPVVLLRLRKAEETCHEELRQS